MIKNYLSILAENGEIILAEIAVAPFVGAWIETAHILHHPRGLTSLPSWERGLKPLQVKKDAIGVFVAPFVGAWIETLSCSSICF